MAALISLAELLAPRSAQQIINDSLAFLANPPDPTLVSVRTANWRTGGPYRTLLYRQGIEGSLLYQILAGFAGSAFLRYAAGKWLDWLGEDYFDEPRQGATFATVPLTLNVPLGAGPIGPIQIKAQTSSGLQFNSINLETIPAGPANFTFQASAAQAGALYNVGANTITQLVTPNVLGISVTNLAAALGGFDAEPDARYAQRLRAKWGVLGTGSPAPAYVYWALTASPEVKKVSVLPNNNNGVFANNYVTLVLSGDATPVSAGAVTAVTNYITPLIPAGTSLFVKSAIVFAQALLGTVKVRSSGLATAPTNIANSVRALDARVPIGGWAGVGVGLSEFVSAVSFDGNVVLDVALTTPAAAVALAFDRLLVTDPSGLTLLSVP